MDDDDLKPCPFCAGTDIEPVYYDGKASSFYAVECADCSSRGPRAEYEDDAERLWNERGE